MANPPQPPRPSVHFPEASPVTQFYDPKSPALSPNQPQHHAVPHISVISEGDDTSYMGIPPPSQTNLAGDNESVFDEIETEEESFGGGRSEPQISAELQRELAEAGKIAKSSIWEFQPPENETEEKEEDSDEGGTKHLYATEYMKAWTPLRYFIYWTFPFNVIQNADNSYIIHSVLVNNINGIGFLVSTIFSILLFLALWIGLFSYFLDIPRQNSTGVAKGTSSWNGRAEEIFLLHRNFPTLIVILAALMHIVVGNLQFYWKRTEIAEYLTFWTEALQIMKIHSAKGVFVRMCSLCFIFATFLLVLLLMGVLNIAPIVRGGPGFLAHICLRVIWSDFFTKEWYPLVTSIFGGIFIYIFFVSKIYVFLYMFKCIIIKNTFSIWSDRLDRVVNRDDNFIVRHDRLGKRTGFKELYQDHVVLLDLIDGADMMFGETIESYFTSTTFSICFECFYLWRALTNREEFPADEFGDRAYDGVVVGFFLLQSVLILLMSAILSIEVAAAAMEGLEVLRRKGFFGRKSGEELYFLMSLYSSYCGPEVTAISGAGYFVLDQSFLVTIVGTFLSYVIILFQFNPPMEFKDDRLVPFVLNRSLLIKRMEGFPGWLDGLK